MLEIRGPVLNFEVEDPSQAQRLLESAISKFKTGPRSRLRGNDKSLTSSFNITKKAGVFPRLLFIGKLLVILANAGTPPRC